jgi:hypothetical protein
MIHKQLYKNYGGFEALSVYKIDAQSFSGSVPTTNMLTWKKDIYQVSFNDINVPEVELKTATEIPYAMNIP